MVRFTLREAEYYNLEVCYSSGPLTYGQCLNMLIWLNLAIHIANKE